MVIAKIKYYEAAQEAKRNYFFSLLKPFITNQVLDTRRLHESQPKLYEEFRLAYGGTIGKACLGIGVYPSMAAKTRANKGESS